MADTAALRETISDEYLEVQKTIVGDSDRGAASKEQAAFIAAVVNEANSRTLLDYGAGKGGLAEILEEFVDHEIEVHEYDPAVSGKETPVECDLVVCIGLLEHVEPDRLVKVLADIAKVTKHYVLFTVDSRPSYRFLPDGRNEHLIKEDLDWWVPRLQRHFSLHSLSRMETGFWAICKRNG